MLALGECPCDEEDQVPQRFSVMPWRGQQSRDSEMRHLCGKGCATQALERFMTKEGATGPGQLEMEAPLQMNAAVRQTG